MVRCACGWEGVHLETMHYHWSPGCRPAEAAAAPKKRDRSASLTLFRNQLMATLSSALLVAHYDFYIRVAHLDHVMTMIVTVALLIVSFIESEADGTAETCAVVRTTLETLPSVNEFLSRGKAKYLRVEPLLLQGTESAKKGAVFFSVIQLVTVLLQESAPVRRACITASEKWKTGVLFNQKPDVYDDLTAGSRFRSNAFMCGKAGPGEENELRIVLHGWTDAFTTVDGLGVNAREHKYGAFLSTLVNLPHRIRHHVDHVLLVALYREVFAKVRGGLCRMLTGTGSDGKQHSDGLTFAAELAHSKTGGTEIELPDDENDGEARRWTLRIFFLAISLDWLAAGEFGPFAGSVSARRPCGKCLWTANCPCAHKAVADAFAPGQRHSAQCRNSAPRTHEGVMQVVAELRSWKSSQAAMQQHMTETGIFSTHFASSFILNDVVRDSTLDIMHLFFCGMSRYLISWLTDIFIPSEFSWDELNAATRAYTFPPGVRIPRLEATKGTPRGSKSIHLTGFATMHFTLARRAFTPAPLAATPTLSHALPPRTHTASTSWSPSSRARATPPGTVGSSTSTSRPLWCVTLTTRLRGRRRWRSA